MGLEMIILSKVSQKEKDKYCMISLIAVGHDLATKQQQKNQKEKVNVRSHECVERLSLCVHISKPSLLIP